MKVAIITGGSSGLGQALVKQYQQAGWQVIEFSRHGDSCSHITLDLASPDQVTAQWQQAIARIDVSALQELLFVNNAGTLEPIERADHLTDADIERNLTINLVSPLRLISHLLRDFRHTPCRKTLINVSSGAANKGYPGWSLYCAAKAGLENFIRTLYLEEPLAAAPFRVCNLDPYVMDTAMQAGIRAATPEQFPQRERFIGYHASGKLLSTDVVAAALRQLAARPVLDQERYGVIDLLAEAGAR